MAPVSGLRDLSGRCMLLGSGVVENGHGYRARQTWYLCH